MLDSAKILSAKQGLAATSIEDIAATAGYTRGAFYSNFSDKQDLFIDLLRRDQEITLGEFAALLRSDSPIEQTNFGMRELYCAYCRSTEGFMSWTEARMLGTRDTKFRAKLSKLLTNKRDRVSELISSFYQSIGSPPPLAPQIMALGLMSLIEGVKLFELSSPSDMTAQAADFILALFMDSIIMFGTSGSVKGSAAIPLA